MIEQHLQDELDALKSELKFRSLQTSLTSHYDLDFSSNDYLGLAKNNEFKSKIYANNNLNSVGAMGSRLLGGNSNVHELCEQVLEKFINYPKCLLFNSGYQLNVGVIPTLYKKGDLILADKYVHASIIDGILQSGASFKRFRHNDTSHLDQLLTTYRHEFRHCLIVTESLFSMHADIAPVKQISELSKRYKSEFMLDEAHSLGVLGPNGKGLAYELGVSPDFIIGTFGKAFGFSGAFIGASSVVCEYLINCCRSFIYTTAMPVMCADSIMKAVSMVETMAVSRNKLIELSCELRRGLIEKGYKLNGEHHIISIQLGSNKKVLQLQQKLRENHINCAAIRHPTVPKNQECIRFSLRADHSMSDIKRVLAYV
jgi:8-amino-7-oxononanoate synthase